MLSHTLLYCCSTYVVQCMINCYYSCSLDIMHIWSMCRIICLMFNAYFLYFSYSCSTVYDIFLTLSVLTCVFFVACLPLMFKGFYSGPIGLTLWTSALDVIVKWWLKWDWYLNYSEVHILAHEKSKYITTKYFRMFAPMIRRAQGQALCRFVIALWVITGETPFPTVLSYHFDTFDIMPGMDAV